MLLKRRRFRGRLILTLQEEDGWVGGGGLMRMEIPRGPVARQ